MPNPPTLEDLLARFNISERQLKDKLSDEHLPAIARIINHEIVGPELGLTQQEMEAIQADGQREEVRRLNTLRKWREKYSINATYEELLKALLNCTMAEQAEKVCIVLSPLPEMYTSDIWSQVCHSESVLQCNGANTSPLAVEQDLSSATTRMAIPESIEQPRSGEESSLPLPTSSTTREAAADSQTPSDPKYTAFIEGLAFLDEKFYKLVDNTANDLKAHPVDLSKVKRELISRRRSDMHTGSQTHLDDTVTTKIENTESVDALIFVLQKIWDPLNPALLQKVVRFGSDNIKHDMEEYMKELFQFRKETRLREFARHSPRQRPDSDIRYIFEVTYKMGKDWEERTLEDFENLKREHARKGYIEEHALNIRGAINSSIILVWEVPFPSYQAAFHQIPHSFFEMNDIKKVTLNGVTLYDSDVDECLSEEGTATTPQNENAIVSDEMADGRPHSTSEYVMSPSIQELKTVSSIIRNPMSPSENIYEIKQKEMIKHNPLTKSYPTSLHPKKEQELLQELKRLKGAVGKVPTPPVGEEFVLSRGFRYSTKYGCIGGNTTEVMILVSVGDEFPAGVTVTHRVRDATMAERAVAKYGHLPPIVAGLHDEIADDIMARASQLLQQRKSDLVHLCLDTPGYQRPKEFYLRAIEEFFEHCQQPAAVLIYLGNSERGTGNWCFKDGTISFEEIFNLYRKKIPQKALSIMPDCSHSGLWVDDCAKMLDDFMIPPCGHRAREHGVLMKVFASCKPHQQAVEPCFSVEGIEMMEEGTLVYYTKTVNEAVAFTSTDFTKLTCCRGPNESCQSEKALKNWTWQQAIHGGLWSRLFIVQGNDKGKQAWHMVLLSNNSDKYKEKFLEKVGTGTINVSEWGYVIQSGWGKDPPQSDREKIERWLSV